MTAAPPAGDDARHHLHAPFGTDGFGRRAEAFARFFGTPAFLIGQTVVVAIWVALNLLAASLRWDPYPFILLNLAFSLQAAYAAPLILLAQTRQADRDRAMDEQATAHREATTRQLVAQQEQVLAQGAAVQRLLEENLRLTQQVALLGGRIEAAVAPEPDLP